LTHHLSRNVESADRVIRPWSIAVGRTLIALIVTAVVCLIPAKSTAQDPPIQGDAEPLRVFLDCDTWRCDSTYFRTEIAFVSWVRDRAVAQVHLIVTDVPTGGGGMEFSLDFLGLEELDGQNDRLTFTSLATDTETEVLEGLTRVIGVATLIGRPPDVNFPELDEIAPTDRLVSADQVDDPWDFWVFEIGADVEFEGEETEDQRRFSGEVQAQRTTEIWKVEFQADWNLFHDRIERTDGTVRNDDRTEWSTDLSVVYALAEHWSLAVRAGGDASTRRNQEAGATLGSAIEYSFFPYAEAPRRSLTAQYGVGLRYFDWEEETIYRETAELRPQHELMLTLFQRQPWGEARASATGRQFLHDLERYSLSLFGELEFRIVRGLDLEVQLDVEWLEDQIFISGEGLTDEDIFLGRFDRPTNYEYELSVGLSFEFGSIFNNVVNNRF
jgi:hypothetical protein